MRVGLRWRLLRRRDRGAQERDVELLRVELRREFDRALEVRHRQFTTTGQEEGVAAIAPRAGRMQVLGLDVAAKVWDVIEQKRAK